MKKTIIISIITLLNLAGCGDGRKSAGDFITVDVTKSYPEKELILQDFMDVEYIPLETTDEFVCQGIVVAIGEKVILVINQILDGNIFVFDRNGKGLKKINRKGQGPEEYRFFQGFVLDEENSEFYVNDISRHLLVYDLNGNFKRSIPCKGNYSKIYSFDSGSLICDDVYSGNDGEATDRPSFVIISKKDGSVLKDIQIPFKQKITTTVTSKFTIGDGDSRIITPLSYPSINVFQNNFILAEPSSDTIFRLLPNYDVIPFMTRISSVQSMEPEIFLFTGILTDRYYFVQTVKKEIAIETWRVPRINLAYDTQEKTLFEYTVYNGDFSTQKPVNMSNATLNSKIAFCQKIEAHELVEAYTKGELKGRLKEVAAKLDAEDNPVIMIVKHKKLQY